MAGLHMQMRFSLFLALSLSLLVGGLTSHDTASTVGHAMLAETHASIPTATKNAIALHVDIGEKSTSMTAQNVAADNLDTDEVWDMITDQQVHAQLSAQRHSDRSVFASQGSGGSASLRSSIRKPSKVVKDVKHSGKSVTPPPIAARRFFFTHHKSGTRLSQGLGEDLSSVLDEHFTEIGHTSHWNQYERYGVAEFANMNVQAYEYLNAKCGDFKAVHFVREAGALTVSGYLYHSHSHDTIPGTGPEQLAGKPLKEGLLIEAQAELRTLGQMLDLHNKVKDDPRVLTVGLEETQRDFDGTMRKIFTHMLGDDHKDIDKLVGQARRFDIERWPEKDRKHSGHIADPANTQAAIQALQEMRDNGNELVQHIFSFDPPLGYE